MKKTIIIFAFIPFVFACTDSKKNNNSAEIAQAKQAAIDSVKQANLISQQQKTIDSLKNVAVINNQKETTKTTPDKATVGSKNGYVSSKSSVPATPVGYSTTKKKKLSNTAKGAIIGAGVGAVTGAVVAKKKGQGAIIGGVVGAGTGAGVGAIIDKKQKEEPKIYY